MEQSAWTDKRLDDRFDHLDAQIHELRDDVRALGGRVDTQGESLRGEIGELRALMFRLHGTSTVVTIGLIAAVLARG
jgi:hypothetical protein